ncbi:MAG: hypothetical protein AB7O96_08685 [Pseudobdellovibrionaceae bacterium]
MTKINIKISTLFIAVSFLTSCTSFPIPSYNVSADNVKSARKLRDKKIAFSIAPFSGNQSAMQKSFACRAAGTVSITDRRNFGQYVSDALKDELAIAEVDTTSASKQLQINFKEINFSSHQSKWTIDSEVNYNGKRSDVTAAESFTISFMGDNACSEIANNFPFIVKKFNSLVLQKIESDP